MNYDQMLGEVRSEIKRLQAIETALMGGTAGGGSTPSRYTDEQRANLSRKLKEYWREQKKKGK